MRQVRFITVVFCLAVGIALTSCGQDGGARQQENAESPLGAGLSVTEVDTALKQINCSESVFDFEERDKLQRLESVPLQGAAVCSFSANPKNSRLMKYTGDLEALANSLTAEDPQLNGGCKEVNRALPAVWVLDAEGSIFQAYIPNDDCADHMYAWSKENIPSEFLESF